MPCFILCIYRCRKDSLFLYYFDKDFTIKNFYLLYLILLALYFLTLTFYLLLTEIVFYCIFMFMKGVLSILC